ncbi:DUF932 domain-containing protein [Micromonospora aurantiaca (nom. illeg.)]|uniref:DUF932 domain-containing protein n=1 Tax=Micromonospora aurantiaca (nom. illeg.) TaxID=47850 RepID=A0ABQ6UPM2_9ACTN|nr:DUF932 domain-containing protein [Micromonospora aurantiaca]KAB1119061.1 DUF932 domain-containing protein [Micromonospora aurantiaca]MBC9005274.1 DUF932 domain-containing protein [Micromonospora aurantiaca]
MTDTLRHSDLAALAAALNDQRTRALDLVVPAREMTFDGAALRLRDVDPVLTDDGVTDPNGRYVPTGVGDEGIAEKLGIPVKYLRRLRTEAPDLYDANVNGWLSRSADSYLVRLLRGDAETVESRGVLRAFLSDRYRTIDNFDVLLAALQGIQRAGVDMPDISADLTDRRMYVRVTHPGVAVYAPQLLDGYRSPFSGRTGTDNPVVFAGFVIANSETGNGAFSITPRIVVEVCNNGMTMTRDAMREVHIGGRLDTGVIRWSADTQRKSLDLVTAQTADAVATFLDKDYVTAKVAELEQAADAPVTDPQGVITTVSRKLGFTEAQQTTILDHFIRGGQVTAGGLLHAVTSAAQTLDDGDAAWDMEAAALPALALAAASTR